MISQVRSEILWLGNKECSPNRERAGFWVMPPCIAFDDVPGHAFAHTPDRSLFFILDMERIVCLHIKTREQRLLPSVGSVGGTFTGIAYLQGKIYVTVSRGSKDYWLIMDERGTLLQRYEVRDSQSKSRPLFGKQIGITGPPYPFQTYLTPSPSLLFLEPMMWRRLCEYTLTGELKQEWEGVTGCAVSHSGQVYVSGTPQPATEIVGVNPPSELKGKSWHLIGMDINNRLYWRSYTRHSVPTKPKKVWAFNQVACTSLDGRLIWQIELDGPSGVLAHYDRHLHCSGGAGGGWIEIEPEGSILVFGVSRSDRIEDAVGLYRVWVKL